MARSSFLATLKTYESYWVSGSIGYPTYDKTEEQRNFDLISHFVASTPEAFLRTHLAGHVTGSSLVVTEDLSRCLLTHHAKLDKWLQLGGHADGDSNVSAVAFKEANEESGLTDLQFVPFERMLTASDKHPMIVDLDVHLIPARKSEPEHFHYDVRYLIFTKTPASTQISAESKALSWFTIEESLKMIDERSLKRFLIKVDFLRHIGNAKWL
jgi:hypothetical protein